MPKKVELSREIEYREIKQRYRKETDYRVKPRLLMLLHVKEGKSATEVSQILKCSKDTVMKWVKRFNESGFEGLLDSGRSGRPRKIDYEALTKALESSPQDYGYPHEAWFPRLVYQYLLDYQEQKDMVPEYVYEVIKRAGYVLRVPRSKHYKSDSSKVEKYKKK